VSRGRRGLTGWSDLLAKQRGEAQNQKLGWIVLEDRKISKVYWERKEFLRGLGTMDLER